MDVTSRGKSERKTMRKRHFKLNSISICAVQAERNHAFGAAIGAVGARLFAVARTNRAALLAGYASTATAEALGADAVRSREHAVAEAVTVAGERGVILYENDLPDHYP